MEAAIHDRASMVRCRMNDGSLPELPPRVQSRFEERARQILDQFEVEKEEGGRAETGMRGSLEHVFIDAHITDGESVRFGPVFAENPNGSVASLLVTNEKGRFRLPEQACQKLSVLVAHASSRREVRGGVGYRYVRDHLLAWLELNAGETPKTAWVKSLLERIRAESVDHRVVIPLEGFRTDIHFSIGMVDFNYITRELVEATIRTIPSDGSAEADSGKQRMAEKLRRAYSGQSFAVLSVHAVEERARSMATESTEEALDVLRCNAMVLGLRIHWTPPMVFCHVLVMVMFDDAAHLMVGYNVENRPIFIRIREMHQEPEVVIKRFLFTFFLGCLPVSLSLALDPESQFCAILASSDDPETVSRLLNADV